MTPREGAATPQRFVIGAADVGQRLDIVVARRLGISTAAARRLVALGNVRVGAGRAAKGTRLVAGAEIEISSAALEAAAPAAPVEPDSELQLHVLYEDAHLVAVDKPAGVPSHPLRPREHGTAANAIVARWPECAAASEDPREGGVAHRLDTPTSGVLLAARSRSSWLALRRALGADDCEKRYLCLVAGSPPDQGTIDVDIGRQGRRGGRVVVGGGRHPQAAETRWKVLARGSRTALVEARLHAGRAHQVRAHLAAAGFPIVGDDRYGASGAEAPAALVSPPGPATALRLHAAALELTHPMTGRALRIEAPPPAWASFSLD